MKIQGLTAAATASAILLAGCGSSADEEPYDPADFSLPVDPAVEELLDTDPRFTEPPLTEEQFVAYCEDVATVWRSSGYGDQSIWSYEDSHCLITGIEVDGHTADIAIYRGVHNRESLQYMDGREFSGVTTPDECQLHSAIRYAKPGYFELAETQGNEYCVDKTDVLGWYTHFHRHGTYYWTALTRLSGLDGQDEQDLNKTFLDATMPAIFEAFPR